MDGRSLAAAELMVFLGLVGWLLYYQYFASRRGSDGRESAAEDGDKGDDSAT